MSVRSDDSVRSDRNLLGILREIWNYTVEQPHLIWIRSSVTWAIFLCSFAPDSPWRTITAQGTCLVSLMTVDEAHFQVKSRTRLMGLSCMLSGHELKSDESSIKTCTVLGKSWSLDLFCEQVCVLWNRKRRLTFELWEDGCRHRFYSTLPHLWQDTSAALISSSLPVIEVNSNSRLTLQSFKVYNGKRKIHAIEILSVFPSSEAVRIGLTA